MLSAAKLADQVLQRRSSNKNIESISCAVRIGSSVIYARNFFYKVRVTSIERGSSLSRQRALVRER